jgi:hypothetical protein
MLLSGRKNNMNVVVFGYHVQGGGAAVYGVELKIKRERLQQRFINYLQNRLFST